MPAWTTPLILLSFSCAPKEASLHDATKVQTTMNQHKSKIKDCYEDAAAKADDFTGGKIRLRAEQNPDGTLSSFREMENFPGSEPIVRCIEKKVRHWNLGNLETRGPIDLTWDFRYSPRGSTSKK